MSDLIVPSDWDIINFVLTATPQEITYTRAIRGFRIKARGETDILHRKTLAASAYSTIKAGTAEPFNMILNRNTSTQTLGFFSIASGSETAEVYVFW